MRVAMRRSRKEATWQLVRVVGREIGRGMGIRR
jgi:hypothetical protein